MENKIILEVALMLICGILCGRLAKLIKLPNVTGYLVAGLLLGPMLFDVIPQSMVSGFGVISDIALAFIAFSVGCGFSLDYFRKVGAAPIVIAIFEGVGAIIVVTVVLVLTGFDFKLALMLGAIASATAPAQTIMVINQYKSRGKLTSLLLSVVAIDDAVALIGFGFASTIVNMLNSKSADTNLALSILSPFYEIIVSFIVGFVFSLGFKFICRFFKKHSNRLCISIAFILGTYWAADLLKGSSLMACMALGAFMINMFDETSDITDICETFSPPIYMIFFIISGAGFDLSQIKSIGILGILYLVLRMVGKMAGSYFGGKLMKQEPKVAKYLGPTLMPQAGVALGLIVVAGSLVPDYAAQIRAVILCSTFVYSFIGPAAAKWALVKAGDIKTENAG